MSKTYMGNNPVQFAANALFYGDTFPAVYQVVFNPETLNYYKSMFGSRKEFAKCVFSHLKSFQRRQSELDAKKLVQLARAYLELSKEGIEIRSEIRSIANELLNKDYENALKIWDEFCTSSFSKAI
jgi:hypothetical protein